MIFSYIKQFGKQNKKIFYYLGFFIIMYFLFSDVSFAKELNSNTAVTTIGGNDLNAGDLLSGFLKFVGVILSFFTYLSTIFLSPNWINGSIFGLNTYFKTIWILVSNIVYFIFAFILIWIAFMNIIGKTGEQYQLKQALPKFIIGILIVPFSWFMVQFILSVSAVLTVGALTLPFDTFKEFSSSLSQVNIPQKCSINLTSFGGDVDTDQTIKCDKKPTVSLESLMGSGDSTSSIFGIMSVYSYGVLSVDRIDDLNWKDLNEVKTFFDLGVQLIFDALFVLIFLILMITLGMVLLVRGIYIWIYIMISPLFGLMFFFGKSEGGEGFFGKFNIKEFISLAMVPVYTMLALSFGLLFIYVVGEGMSQNTGGISSDSFSIDNENNVIKLGSGKEKFELKIKGPVSRVDNVTGFLTNFGNGTLGIVGSLILKVFAIVILWGSIMAAMRTSKITEAITQPIYDFGSKVGGIVASAPGNIPVFGGQSMRSMGQAASTIQSTINQGASTKGSDLAGKFIDVNGHSKEINKHKEATSENAKKGGIDYMIKNLENANSNQVKDFNEMLNNYGYKGNINLEQKDTVQQKAEKLKLIFDDNNISFTGKGNTEYKAVSQLRDRIDNGDSAIRSPNSNSGGNNNEISSDKIIYGKVNMKVNYDIEPTQSGNTTLNSATVEGLARAISEGLKGQELKDALSNMSITSTSERNILKNQIESYIKVGDDNKITEITNGENGNINFDKLLKGDIEKK